MLSEDCHTSSQPNKTAAKFQPMGLVMVFGHINSTADEFFIFFILLCP